MTGANPSHRESWWFASIWVSVGTAAAYGALLGWDQRKTLGADGYQHGPYQDWQVFVLVMVMGALAWWAGRHRGVWLSSVAATVVMTALWSIDAATDQRNDGLWPVGAMGVLVATGLGFTVVAHYFKRVRVGPRRPR